MRFKCRHQCRRRDAGRHWRGLAELSNATLTAEKRQDIAQAMGIPMTMMFFRECARGLAALAWRLRTS